MNSHLQAWYKKRHVAMPKEVLTRINTVTRKMVGGPADRKLKTKASETWGLLLFLQEELHRLRPRLDGHGAKLADATNALAGMLSRFDVCGVKLQEADLKYCWEAYLRFLSLTANFEDMQAPKRHIVLHILRRVPFLGNPRFYATWTDEGLGKVLKATTRGVSQATFELNVLGNMKRVLARELKKRKHSGA